MLLRTTRTPKPEHVWILEHPSRQATVRKPDISLNKFKSLLFGYYFSATISIFDIEKQQSWNSVCL